MCINLLLLNSKIHMKNISNNITVECLLDPFLKTSILFDPSFAGGGVISPRLRFFPRYY